MQIIDSYILSKWAIVNIIPLAKSSFTGNYVAKVYSEKYSSELVLKILNQKEDEIEALQYFNGNGCVKLVDYDKEYKSLLIEYIKPGYTLKKLFPEQDLGSIEIVCDLIQKMQLVNNPINYQFKTVFDWLKLLNNFNTEFIPKYLFDKAQIILNRVTALEQNIHVLHGDLHHENIIKKSDSWIAIDPKGIVGPLEYEVGRFIMNPMPELLKQTNLEYLINSRVDRFSQILKLEKDSLVDWLFLQVVLNCCWAKEDGNKSHLEDFLYLAPLIYKMV